MNISNPPNQGLFETLCNRELLKKSFQLVKRNKGAPGIDGQSIETFELFLEESVDKLINELTTWQYKPLPVRRVDIPKPNGGTRMLGIPCVRDRVVQTAVKTILEPIFDKDFSNHSYGFRPGRNQHQAIEAASKIVASGKEFVVDIDLAKFFDTINHNRLIARMGIKISDNRILRLIGMTLRSGIMDNGLVTETTEGSPQGSPLSPLLSNIVLDELDKELESRGIEFCRFADDCNLYVKTDKAARRVMESTCDFIERKLRLKVNKEKSKTAKSKHLKFLGVTILTLAIAIAYQSTNRAMDKVCELTPRGTHKTIDERIKAFNKWYVGWTNYYKVTNYPSQFEKIEAHFRRRMRATIIKQQKNRRNLFENLIKRGVPRKVAASCYANKGMWAMSHFRAVERAYPNKYFEQLGMKIRSKANLDHWYKVRKRIKLT